LSSSQNDEWVVKGMVTASDCFRCRNKLDSKTDGYTVYILCRDQCNYEPITEEKPKEPKNS
jgi:hypothetical protein